MLQVPAAPPTTTALTSLLAKMAFAPLMEKWCALGRVIVRVSEISVDMAWPSILIFSS